MDDVLRSRPSQMVLARPTHYVKMILATTSQLFVTADSSLILCTFLLENVTPNLISALYNKVDKYTNVARPSKFVSAFFVL
jgi:hypothetical protein